MLDHPNEDDNHNAEPFAHCYRRLADLLPELINEGCSPRIMLDYSGNLLWGIEQMGRRDIGDALHYLACDPLMQGHVEWLGTFWSHAVAPSPDLKLQISAWQQQFAACFGTAALERVKGFSPPEMAPPNYPDTLFEFVKALKQAGYSVAPGARTQRRVRGRQPAAAYPMLRSQSTSRQEQSRRGDQHDSADQNPGV